MKRLLSLLLLVAATATGQQVDSSQMKTKTNGGLGAGTDNALAVKVYRGTTAPVSPVTGQPWCDTNTTPCTLRVYTGTAWEAAEPLITVPVQNSISSFPGSPADGQIFYSKAQHSFFVWDDTASLWLGGTAIGLVNAGQTFVDAAPAGGVITPPSSAPSVAKRTSCGGTWNPTSGTISYKVTFYNSTGGETTGSPKSADIAYSAGTDCIDLTSIPTGGTGTVGRRIYRSLQNAQDAEWFWIWTLTDNTTTIYTDTSRVINSNLKLLIPQVNFSGALSDGWTYMNDFPNTSTGGAGTTADGHFRYKAPGGSALAGDGGIVVSSTDSRDVSARIVRDISAYKSSDYDLEIHFTAFGREPPKYLDQDWTGSTSGMSTPMLGLRRGTEQTQVMIRWGEGFSCNGCYWQPNGGCHGHTAKYRTAPGGAAVARFPLHHGWPYLCQGMPVWWRVTKRSNAYMFWESGDYGVTWVPKTSNENARVCIDTTWFCGWTFDPAMDFDTLELGLWNDIGGTLYYNWVYEWDSLTITPQ